MDRQYSIQFLDALYALGAEVEVSKFWKTGDVYLVLELTIVANYVNSKQILIELIKTRPLSIEEIVKNIFRITWLGK